MQHLYKSIVCTHCGELIRVPVYCKNRFCEVCGPARRYRAAEKIKHVLKCADFSGGYFLGMVTVSLPNSLDLGEGIRKLQKSWSLFRRTQLFKKYIRGGLYVIEITGKPGAWHPHIHCLVEQKFLSWRTFRDRWEALTGATAFHVKRIPRGAAEKYITKYITKPPGTPEEVEQAASELRHVRLFQCFGSWHGKLGSFVKAQYPCPKCGRYTWLPLDLLENENYGKIIQKRAPPRRAVRRQEPVLEPRRVVEQGALGDIMTASRRSTDGCGRPLWDPTGRY